LYSYILADPSSQLLCKFHPYFDPQNNNFARDIFDICNFLREIPRKHVYICPAAVFLYHDKRQAHICIILLASSSSYANYAARPLE
jgi:hypothetical protein